LEDAHATAKLRVQRGSITQRVVEECDETALTGHLSLTMGELSP
jgi:hypothetical protein